MRFLVFFAIAFNFFQVFGMAESETQSAEIVSESDKKEAPEIVKDDEELTADQLLAELPPPPTKIEKIQNWMNRFKPKEADSKLLNIPYGKSMGMCTYTTECPDGSICEGATLQHPVGTCFCYKYYSGCKEKNR